MSACERHLSDRGELGYACARNLRMLAFSTSDYLARRDEAVRRHGTPADGGGTSISPRDEGWAPFLEEMGPLDAIEHEVDVTTVEASRLVGKLSGAEMLEIGFMLDWGDDKGAGNGDV